jgi:hypothetical protein
MMTRLLFGCCRGIAGIASTVGGSNGSFFFPLGGVPGNGLLDLEERLVRKGAEGGLQPLDLPGLQVELLLEPPPQPLLLLEAAQVEVCKRNEILSSAPTSAKSFFLWRRS